MYLCTVVLFISLSYISLLHSIFYWKCLSANNICLRLWVNKEQWKAINGSLRGHIFFLILDKETVAQTTAYRSGAIKTTHRGGASSKLLCQSALALIAPFWSEFSSLFAFCKLSWTLRACSALGQPNREFSKLESMYVFDNTSRVEVEYLFQPIGNIYCDDIFLAI